MKAYITWMFSLLAAGTTLANAASAYDAYRLGNYDHSYEPLAANAGKDVVADYYLGRIYLYGYGQLKNNHLALRYFTDSAKKGYLPAQLFLAKYELHYKKNPELAFQWFKQAADKGDIHAKLYVAAAYIYGLGVRENPGLAERYYIDASKAGNPLAQFYLAENFIGSRQSSNKKLGVIWLNKSANAGNPQAQTLLAEMLYKGQLMTTDKARAEELLTKAIAQNYWPALAVMGDLALEQKDTTAAVDWYKKAADKAYLPAEEKLANLYLNEKGGLYDPKSGFLWMLKAAQGGLASAQQQLATLYKNGLGVAANSQLADEWLKKAALTEKVKLPAEVEVAQWLTNGSKDNLNIPHYRLEGIVKNWSNQVAHRENSYNSAPKEQIVSRQYLFKPQFVLTQPDEVGINEYYDALVKQGGEFADNQWYFPVYQTNRFVHILDRYYSYVVQHPQEPLPYYDEYVLPESEQDHQIDWLANWSGGWQKEANYMALFDQLYFHALLGDAEAQFALAQMFQYGKGVNKSVQQAITYYEKAAYQLHVGAEYSLGIIYITDKEHPENFQRGIDWLTDAAYKGNSYAEYVLGNMMIYGLSNWVSKPDVKLDRGQGMDFLYLSAANGYGQAEYELADILARDQQSDLSVKVRQAKDVLIRELYTHAVEQGVAEADLPLAFYNAMSTKKNLQDEAFKVASAEAEKGNPQAALLLGMLYDRGIGTTRDQDQAIAWYQKAGDNPVSSFILGTYLAEGKGIGENQDKGMQLLQEASKAQFSYADLNLAVLEEKTNKTFLPHLIQAYALGNAKAGLLLADYYLAKQENQQDMQQAQEIYDNLASKGDQYAQLKLGFMLEKGLGYPADETKALNWYTLSAQQGNPVAQYQLAQLYLQGVEGEQDYSKAVYWLKKSAEQLPMAANALGFVYETVADNYSQALAAYKMASQKGYTLADYNLGLIYEYGKGVPVDYKQAMAYYEKAAQKQVNGAMAQIAGLYFNGLGVARDEQKAIEWYEKAAKLGNAAALYHLGLMSETGVATKLDFAQALHYYQQSAERGNEKAMLALARMYHFGLGVNKDPGQSLSIYEKLADRNNAYAQYKLATYYLDSSQGTPQVDKGRQWLLKASANGSQQAKKALQRLDAQAKPQVSFIESVNWASDIAMANQSAELLYFDALSEWNRGDELASKQILKQLVKQFPHFEPAQKAYERLNQAHNGEIYG